MCTFIKIEIILSRPQETQGFLIRRTHCSQFLVKDVKKDPKKLEVEQLDWGCRTWERTCLARTRPQFNPQLRKTNKKLTCETKQIQSQVLSFSNFRTRQKLIKKWQDSLKRLEIRTDLSHQRLVVLQTQDQTGLKTWISMFFKLFTS